MPLKPGEYLATFAEHAGDALPAGIPSAGITRQVCPCCMCDQVKHGSRCCFCFRRVPYGSQTGGGNLELRAKFLKLWLPELGSNQRPAD